MGGQGLLQGDDSEGERRGKQWGNSDTEERRKKVWGRHRDKVEMVERKKSLKFQWKGTDWKEEVKREERETG